MTRFQRVATGLTLVVLLLAVPRLALEGPARVDVEQLRTQVAEQQARNAQQRIRNEELREEIEALSSDPRSVERVLRHELRALRPDEHAFVFREDLAPSAR